MNRIRTFVTVMLPSMIAGGFLFGSAFGHAASGDPDLAFWPNQAPVVIAQADPPKPPKPGAPTPPKAPPPAPPTPPAPAKGGVGVSIDNGVIKLTGVRDLVASQLAAARAAIKANPKIPADVRAKILARLDKVGGAVDKRLSNLKLDDLDKLGEEMEKMGDEIEEAMDGLDDDLAKLGDKLGKDLAKDLSNLKLGHDDDDDDDDDVDVPDVDDADDADMRDAISDLKDLALKPAQRDQINKLRADSDKTVASSKKQVQELSEKLHTALGNPAVTDADIAKLVDQISAHEASMRKARILAWAQARRVLDAQQRKKVEDAAAKTKPKTK